MTRLTSPAGRYITGSWDRSINVDSPGTGFGGIDLPYPYTSACIRGEGKFSFFFYWDTYFTNVGLLASRRFDAARHNILNTLWLVDRQGYMPNHVGLFNRSQPPYLCRMIRDYFALTAEDGVGSPDDYRAVTASPDAEFFRQCVEGVRKEYQFWITARATMAGLCRYGHHTTTEESIAFYDRILVRRLGFDETAPEDVRAVVGSHYLGEAESGWDFCQRFDGRCLDFAAVDLNALLLGCERFLAEAGELLGWTDAHWYRDAAQARHERINRLLWDETTGWFLDYDFVNRRRSTVMALTGCLPLFEGLASSEQASRVAANLPEFERDHGLAVTPQTPGCRSYQWAYPNVWPCMVYVTVAGLAAYGLHEHARRIARSYLATSDALFEETGMLWEKTDAETGAVAGGEYDAAPMLGWSAGAYLGLAGYLDHGTFPGYTPVTSA